jgi:hypothetical protein
VHCPSEVCPKNPDSAQELPNLHPFLGKAGGSTLSPLNGIFCEQVLCFQYFSHIQHIP